MSGLLIDLPVYQSRYTVQALQIKIIIPNPRGHELHFVDERFAPHQVSESAFYLYKVKPGDYVVFDGGFVKDFYSEEKFNLKYQVMGDRL